MHMEFHVLQTQFIKMAILLIIFPLKSSLSTTPPSPNLPIANPNCLDRCGDLRIPFPFGTTENCYLSIHFFVTCNETLNPPTLFWANTSIQIIDISLDGQIRIMQFIIRECYTQNGTRIPGNSNNRSWISLAQFFTVNSTANRLTIVGCDNVGFVSGHRLDRKYRTGCISICYAEEDLAEGSCSGLGCCQTFIPSQVWEVNLKLKSYNNYTLVNNFNNCSYAFLVEETAFSFSPKNLTNLRKVKKLPMVVDWAIGNATCEEAKNDSTSYACKSLNSKCYKPNNGYGYRCNCKEGYRGNPYISDGCQDINECQDPNLNICVENSCENTVGGFNCFCPKGYHGDGKRDGKGCNRGESLVYKLVAGIAVGVIVLMVATCFLYWELKRRRKQKYFRENGGPLLQEKITKTEGSRLEIYKFSVLQKAMNFHDSMILSEGGYGTVCKGHLDDRIVSIKKTKKVDPTQIEQFINEVIALSQINHVNLVKLLGCCLDTQIPLLVYEFISNGTLYKHLHNQAKECSLHWDMRLKIAAETAGALFYLHSGASLPLIPHSVAGMYSISPETNSKPIVHKNLKSENIFLDDNFTVKVADFGISILDPVDRNQSSTMVQGTVEISDPEYREKYHWTEKNDVYNFGVVLVELVTGMKAIDEDKPEEEKYLGDFFLSTLEKEALIQNLVCEGNTEQTAREEEVVKILDKNIVGEVNRKQLIKVIRVTKECLNKKRENRPDSKDVALELQGVRFDK